MTDTIPHVAIIGAGIGGLAAALRLSHAGLSVTVLERHSTPGGKMRTVHSEAGPVDAGPTVLTMKPVFEALFADVAERLEDHITLIPEPILARHFWQDGTCLDLMADRAASAANVAACFGSKAGREFERFSARAAALFQAFDSPMMRAARPSQMTLATQVMRQPALIPAMAPHRNLASSLKAQFAEPKLVQLFARYATYVGGRPDASPAIVSLIADAEAQGVWHVKGGMHQLAKSIEALAQKFGATFLYDQDVADVRRSGKKLTVTTGSEAFAVDIVLFNGDPRALRMGKIGTDCSSAVTATQTQPRSLSAYVNAFAAKVTGPQLAGHNVFFGDDPAGEFGPLADGRMPDDPTLYICAQDRFAGGAPEGQERFEIIMNGPPAPDGDTPSPEEVTKCQTRTVNRLKQFGLNFSPVPGPAALTTPAQFGQMFPASNGSLYGRSPHGLMAAFKRPTARTPIKGLYLVGGGAHPGAGVPMATLSARHAAAAILSDLSSTSTFRQRVTRGGMSTGSAMTAAGPSRS